MSWKNIVRGIIGGAKQAQQKKIILKHGVVAGNKSMPEEPATPEPNYICQNCGMLIKTFHKHTRQECQEYQDTPVNPDLRAHRTILPGRNDPKINLPYYYDSSTSNTKGEHNES